MKTGFTAENMVQHLGTHGDLMADAQRLCGRQADEERMTEREEIWSLTGCVGNLTKEY